MSETSFISDLNLLEAVYDQRFNIEDNKNFKQPIPYILLCRPDGKIASFQRKGTEKRLHGLWSCGIGGHVDAKDEAETNFKTIEKAMNREADEELEGSFIINEKRFIGIINEDESKVGRVHIGFVFLWSLADNENLPIAGTELGEIFWQSSEDLKATKTELWSDLSLKLLYCKNPKLNKTLT